ncbi:DUF2804 domain-containing protein [bacterium]
MAIKKEPKPAPESLVCGGRVNFGNFDAPPSKMNMLDAEIFGAGVLNPKWLKKLRLKQWQFYMVVHPECTFGFLVIDLAFVASSFIYVFDRKTGDFSEHSRIKMDKNFSIAESLLDGRCWFKDKKYSIDIRNNLNEGYHHISLDIGTSRKEPSMKAEFRMMQTPDYVRPLVVSLPVGENRGMYSHKVICPAEGSFSLGKREFKLDPARDVCILDEHKAFYPRHTYWKWATFGFVGDDGKIVGMNMTDNLIKDQENWNENAIWSGGEITLLGPAKFYFDMEDIMKPWKIRDTEGKVELVFSPQGAKVDKTNALILKMHYLQPFGLFNGFLTDAAGKKIEIADRFGITEYHDAYY